VTVRTLINKCNRGSLALAHEPFGRDRTYEYADGTHEADRQTRVQDAGKLGDRSKQVKLCPAVTEDTEGEEGDPRPRFFEVRPSSGSIKPSPPGGEWVARIREIVQSLGLALIRIVEDDSRN
jgi:hypothetical protein